MGLGSNNCGCHSNKSIFILWQAVSTGIGKDVNSVPHQSTQHAHAWIFLTAKICMPETQSSDDCNAILINIECNNHTITWGLVGWGGGGGGGRWGGGESFGRNQSPRREKEEISSSIL